MTAEWFDLGLRFRAAAAGQPQPRLMRAPLTAAPHPVAVRAALNGEHVQVTAATTDHLPATANGHAALDLLGTLGVTVSAPAPATLVSDQPNVLDLLWRLARATNPATLGEATAAHIAWWRDRADFPGGRAVTDITAACRTRWATGCAPAAESQPAVWRHWLGVADDSVSGLLDTYRLLTAGVALPWLDTLAGDDTWSYGTAQSQHADGWDWRRPDTPGRAALGLRSRCDAADLYAAALLCDPLHRARAVHTGHVVTGIADPLGDRLKRCQVTCTRLDSRLRPGNAITGWVGTPTDPAPSFSATVATCEVEQGHLVLTLSGVTGAGPGNGQQVTMHPAPPNPFRQRAGRKSYRSLYAARRSWLTTGRTPTPSRRDVPLDVLVAGAEPE